MMRSLTVAVLLLAGLLGGCAKQQPYDYTAFRESRPASILVLPPLNESPDLKGRGCSPRSPIRWPSPVTMCCRSP